MNYINHWGEYNQPYLIEMMLLIWQQEMHYQHNKQMFIYRMKCSWDHVIISFIQSRVSLRSEPRPVLACELPSLSRVPHHTQWWYYHLLPIYKQGFLSQFVWNKLIFVLFSIEYLSERIKKTITFVLHSAKVFCNCGFVDVTRSYSLGFT